MIEKKTDENISKEKHADEIIQDNYDAYYDNEPNDY